MTTRVGALDKAESEDPVMAAAVRRAIAHLRVTQLPDGTWDAPIECDASLTAHHILMMHYLRRHDPVIEGHLVRFVRATQNHEGGWSAFPGAPSDLDATVVCYAALKAAGATPDDPGLARARSVIARLGGLGCTSISARIPLAFAGQIPLTAIPALTPKIVSLPDWFHPNLYDLSLVRLALVPLALLTKLKAVRPLPPGHGVEELLSGSIKWGLKPNVPPGAETAPKVRERLSAGLTWRAFGALSSVFRVIDSLFPNPSADRRAFDWIVDRQESDGTISGVFLTTMLSLMALDNAPGGISRAQVDKGLQGLESWLVHDPRGWYQQYMMCKSLPTACALQTLLEAGAAEDDPAVVSAVAWLVDHQAKVPGDWQRRVRGAVEPGGWYLGVAADQYPDVDCSIMVLLALFPVRHLCSATFRRGIDWILAMEDRDGGWAAWDRNNRRRMFLSPEIIMPGVADLRDADITARALFVLGPLAGTSYDRDGRIGRAVERGVDFLRRRQEPDGSWYGHWTVNYAFGTAQVLQGLVRAGVSTESPGWRKAIGWLRSIQNPDGGWGESKASYRTGRYEPGPSNPYITAVVVEGLVAADGRDGTAVKRGLRYLAATQESDGSWEDKSWCGVTIARVSYIRYNVIPTCVAAVSILRNWGSFESTFQLR